MPPGSYINVLWEYDGLFKIIRKSKSLYCGIQQGGVVNVNVNG